MKTPKVVKAIEDYVAWVNGPRLKKNKLYAVQKQHNDMYYIIMYDGKSFGFYKTRFKEVNNLSSRQCKRLSRKI